MDTTLVLGTLLVGMAVGFLGGLFGKGGSAMSTPVLHAMGVPAALAIASPLPATIPTTLLSSRTYARAGHLDPRVLRLGLVFGLPATALGAILTAWIPPTTLVLATDVLLLVIGARMLLSRSVAERAGREPVERADVIVALVIAVGIVAGLLGNTGGALFAPLFVSVLRMPLKRALGTSLALASAFAVPGTIVHAALGHVDWLLAGAFATGSIPLGVAGTRLALRLRDRSLGLAWGTGLVAIAGGLLLVGH
jgi:uncharacterized membrane protein YfcA